MRIENQATDFSENCSSALADFAIAKTLAKGGAFIFAGSLVGRGIKFITEVILGRSLGPDSFGIYVLGLSVLTVLRHFSTLGLKTGVLRFGAGYFATKEYSKFRGLVRFSLLSVTGTGLVCCVALVFLSGYLANHVFSDGRLTSVFYLVGIGLPAYGAMWVVSEAILAQRRAGTYTLLEHIGQPLFFLVLVGILLLFGLTSYKTLAALVISLGLTALVGLVLVLRSRPFREERQDRHKVFAYEQSRWLKYSLPLIVVGISYMLLHETDRLMLGYFLGATSVGLYEAAARLAYMSEIFINSFAGIFSPLAAGFHHSGEREKIRYLLVTTTRWTLILTLPVVGLLLIFPKFFLGWFGRQYEVVAYPLMFMAVAYLTSAGTGNTGALLKMVDRQNVEVINTVVTALLNIVLNFLFIPLYGIMGAAIGTGLSIIVIQIIKLVEVKIFLGFTPYELNILKPLLSGIVSGSITLLVKSHLNFSNSMSILVCMGIFLVCYILLLFLFGIEKEERALIRHLHSLLQAYQPT